MLTASIRFTWPSHAGCCMDFGRSMLALGLIVFADCSNAGLRLQLRRSTHVLVRFKDDMRRTSTGTEAADPADLGDRHLIPQIRGLAGLMWTIRAGTVRPEKPGAGARPRWLWGSQGSRLNFDNHQLGGEVECDVERTTLVGVDRTLPLGCWLAGLFLVVSEVMSLGASLEIAAGKGPLQFGSENISRDLKIDD